jgi:hypothetical protein
MWCHFCEKNNHNTTECRAIARFKLQKIKKDFFEAKAGPGKKSLAFSFEKFNLFKRYMKLKLVKTSRNKKRNKKV